MKKFLSGVAAFATALSLLLIPVAPALAANTTIVVSGDTAAGYDQPGWLFNRDLDNTTPFEFNADTASIGVGSLYVAPIGATAADKFTADNFLNSLVSDVNSISYDFKLGAGSDSDEEQFYLNVYANFSGSDEHNYYDCRFDYVPATGSTANFTPFTVTPGTTPTNVTHRSGPACPPTLAGMGEGAKIREFVINVGDSSPNDEGVSGYLDKVVVNLETGVRTYDFEPTEICSTLTLESDTATQQAGYTETSPVSPLAAASYSGAWASAFATQTVIPPWIDPAANANFTGAIWVSTDGTWPGGSGNTEGDPTNDQWRLFQESFALPANATVSSANVAFTADNAAEVYLNGSSVGTTGDVYGAVPGALPLHFASVFNAALSPTSGTNTLDFVVRNWGGPFNPNPTGLLYKTTVDYCEPVPAPECPAAPSIAAHYLKDQGYKPNSTTSKNIVSQVANAMTQGAVFEGIGKCDEGYAEAVEAFVNDILGI